MMFQSKKIDKEIVSTNFLASKNLYKNCFISKCPTIFCNRYIILVLIMKSFASHQLQGLIGEHKARVKPKTKCALVAIYENDGKTIMQPLITEQDATSLLELFENQTLEVWLSNGKSDFLQFDVAILKYKQVLQSSTKCTQAKTRACLMSLYENLVYGEQCHLSSKKTGESQ